MKLKHIITTLFSFCVVSLGGVKTVEAASFTVVADGLDNVQGLGIGPDGSVYAVEAGKGGSGPCVPPPSGQGDNLCYGATGAVTRVKDGKQERVLTGLPSISVSSGAQAAGPRNILFDSTGKPYVVTGLGANPSFRNDILGDIDLGKIIAPDFNTNTWTSVSDIASYELANNPDGENVSSSPISFLLDGNNFVVVDSSANDLLSVGTDGSNLRAIAAIPKQTIVNPVFPPSNTPSVEPSEVPDSSEPPPVVEFSTQAVPTGIAKGPDGAYYISIFTGFPFPKEGAKIYKIGDDGQPTVYAEGFTQLRDLAFDTEGNLYALQYANEPSWTGNLNGSVIKVTPDGTRTTLISGNGVEGPSGLAIGSDGAVYIANRSGVPGKGQVLRVNSSKSVPEPTSTLSILGFGALSIYKLRKGKRKALKVPT
ncbi:ScyD/ScyE family protein [Scytonema sp. NUACC26]|uniref:ScyD/ScyE family protein n=1 Tax=Scytonema sp. NUACC26 TaxID=3140176 RepID=UPI0034DBF375